MACKGGVCKPSSGGGGIPKASGYKTKIGKKKYTVTNVPTKTEAQIQAIADAAGYSVPQLKKLLGEGPGLMDFSPQFQESLRFEQSPYARFPYQQQLQQALSPQIPQELMQQFDFSPIREQAVQSYQEQTKPTIADRFAAMGAQRSSGREQALAQGQRGLERDLAAEQSKFGLQSQRTAADLYRGLTGTTQTNLVNLLRDYGGLQRQGDIARMNQLGSLVGGQQQLQGNIYGQRLNALQNMLQQGLTSTFDTDVYQHGSKWDKLGKFALGAGKLGVKGAQAYATGGGSFAGLFG